MKRKLDAFQQQALNKTEMKSVEGGWRGCTTSEVSTCEFVHFSERGGYGVYYCGGADDDSAFCQAHLQ